MQSFVYGLYSMHFFYVNDKTRRNPMETFWMYFLFAIGVVLIIKGGDWFVDGAVWVAEVTRIPRFIIGATIALIVLVVIIGIVS